MEKLELFSSNVNNSQQRLDHLKNGLNVTREEEAAIQFDTLRCDTRKTRNETEPPKKLKQRTTSTWRCWMGQNKKKEIKSNKTKKTRSC